MGLSFPLPNPVPVSQGGTGTSTPFTLGSVLFAGAGGVYAQDNAHFLWDTTFQFLTITGSGLTLNLLTGGIYLRDNGSNGVEMHIRPGAGKAGGFTFTENAVADRWVVGIKPGDAALYFSTGNIGAPADKVILDGSGNVELVGGALTFSSTTSVQKRTQSSFVASWVVSTDASRSARLVCNVWDTAAREVWRGEASGTAALIGFLGAAAVARPTVTGSRGANAALASLLTALANLGLITNSSTA